MRFSLNTYIDLNDIWKDRGIPTVLKVQLLKSLIWPVMMYGSEAWTLRSDEANKIDAAELWFYRRLLRVSWTDKRTNESILSELNTIRISSSAKNKRKLRYVGHTVRHNNTSLLCPKRIQNTILLRGSKVQTSPPQIPAYYSMNFITKQWMTYLNNKKYHHVRIRV